MDNNYENIVPWNGEKDTGRDVRLKLERNFKKIGLNFQELEGKFTTADELFDLIAEELEKKLSSTDDDEAAGLIHFLKGLISEGLIQANGGIQYGPSFVPGLLGEGGMIDETGRGELRSLRLWEFLEVPELRFNRVQIYTGIDWNTFGGGVIESVEIDYNEEGVQLQSGIITLKLEKGEFGAVSIDDMAMGVFHRFGGQNDTANEDQKNGNFHFSGFSTSYFRITEILDEGTNGRFRYVLRGISERWNQQHHPQPFMHFACYANPTDKSRQSCVYATTEYTLGLRDMTTWEYGESNIYKISGVLDGFSLNGKHFKGTGDVIGNGYFYGSIEMFENAPYRMELDNGGDGFLAYGETTTITCRVYRGWEDVTSGVETWQITRESGIQADDDVWNLNHLNFKGTIVLGFQDLGENANTISTLFRFFAASGSNNTVFELII